MVRKWFVTAMMPLFVFVLCLSNPLPVTANNESQSAGRSQNVLAELKKTREQLMKWERQIAALDEEIAQKKMNLIEKQKTLNKLEARFEAVLVHMYKMNRKNLYLYYLLRANSVSEFLMRLDILSFFVKNEQSVIQRYLDEKKALEEEVASIEQSRDKKEALLKEAKQHLAHYTTLYQKSQTLLPSQEQQPEEVQKVHQVNKNRQVRNSRSSDVAVAPPSRKTDEESLAWPQPGGKVTSRFGKTHEGIDISNSLGSPIVAADSGIVVLIKSDPGGYDYYIVIDHGNGLKTLYAHMYPSTVQVEVGDHVEKGQKIASVGNFAWEFKPHLHFEIHQNGKPVDPMQYY